MAKTARRRLTLTTEGMRGSANKLPKGWLVAVGLSCLCALASGDERCATCHSQSTDSGMFASACCIVCTELVREILRFSQKQSYYCLEPREVCVLVYQMTVVKHPCTRAQADAAMIREHLAWA